MEETFYHVIYTPRSGSSLTERGISLETNDCTAANREIGRLKMKGYIASARYGERDKLQRRAKRDWGKDWLRPIE